MNYLLNIHTTETKALVNLAEGRRILSTAASEKQHDHAGFLHIAIKKILQDNDIEAKDLKGVGVSGGPGSYTGIRVGLASAKGLCYALQIPMMVFNSLELMASSAIDQLPEAPEDALFCPMIDARRMEVFTAVYDRRIHGILEPTALILSSESFEDLIDSRPFYCFGTGARKFIELIEGSTQNLQHVLCDVSPESLAKFSFEQFERKNFTNVLSADALYVKEFYTPAKTV